MPASPIESVHIRYRVARHKEVGIGHRYGISDDQYKAVSK